MNPYADFVMQTDGHMGELLAAIKEAGIDDDTLVFFTSDNGCSPEGNFAKLKEFGHDPSAGYRGHKADVYEGGHRVPFIARWPKGIKAGQKTNALACLTDLYDTMREITGQPKKDNGGEDSFSLLPAFKGKGKTSRSTLVSHSIGGSFSMRHGDWKLCLSAGSGGWSAPREGDAKEKEPSSHATLQPQERPGGAQEPAFRKAVESKRAYPSFERRSRAGTQFPGQTGFQRPQGHLSSPGRGNAQGQLASVIDPTPVDMNNLFPATLIPLFALAFISSLEAETWRLESPADWKKSIESSQGLTIEKGVASPTAKTGSLRTKLKSFKEKRSAKSLTIEQSALWQNWEAKPRIGPKNLGDAPVFLTMGPGNYWMFGRYRGMPKKKGQKPFEAEDAKLDGFDIPLKTTPLPNQFNAPGGLVKVRADIMLGKART